jgi:RNA-directed DNA polymerase
MLELDQWLRRKVRVVKLKQLKRRYTIFQFLKAHGVKAYQAWILALSGKGWWRMSRCPQAHQAMGTQWFKEQGLAGVTERWNAYQTP